MQRNKRLSQFVSFGLVLGIMLIVFMLSNQPAEVSRQASNRFIYIYQKIVGEVLVLPKDIRYKLLIGASHYVRKAAHLTIYALLGSVSATFCSQLPIEQKRTWRLALLICILYAMTDELHQWYIEGRGAQWSDVLLDGLGSLLGIGIFHLVKKLLDTYKKI